MRLIQAPKHNLHYSQQGQWHWRASPTPQRPSRPGPASRTLILYTCDLIKSAVMGRSLEPPHVLDTAPLLFWTSATVHFMPQMSFQQKLPDARSQQKHLLLDYWLKGFFQRKAISTWQRLSSKYLNFTNHIHTVTAAQNGHIGCDLNDTPQQRNTPMCET